MLPLTHLRRVSRKPRSTARAVVGLTFAVFLTLSPMPASAHTGFESSSPADGALLSDSVETITMVFTAEAEPTGDGFQILDANGVLRIPTDATSPDGRTWILRLDPPLATGEIGVRWKVKAPDKHPIEGGFRFTINTPDAVTSDLPPSAAQTPPSSVSSLDGTPNETTSEEGTTTDSAELAAGSRSIDDFLAVDSSASQGAARLGVLGRILGLSGTLLGIGALAFALLVLRAPSSDVTHVIHWVRRAGILAIIGSVLESASQLVVESGSWSGIWSPSTIWAVFFSSFGIAIALRIAGGYLLVAETSLEIGPAVDAADPVRAVRELVSVSVGHVDQRVRSGSDPANGTSAVSKPTHPYHQAGDAAWAPTIDSAGALVGSALLLASFAFDGHTASKGDRVITAIVNTVHVTGAAVWTGGLLMLAIVLWRRKRQDRDLRALQLALRFSVVAAIALAFVGAAGLLLTIIVLDSPQDLWLTAWGRILMLKTLAVALAAAMGAYNHRVLIPQLTRDPDNPELDREFRRTVTAESLALLVVVILTAFLVGAAS